MFRYSCFLLSWISLVGISSAGELPSWIGEASVAPVDAQGFASVTLGGVWNNSCVPSSIAHAIDGETIQLDLAHPGVGTVCAEVLTEWSLEHNIGPLDSGTYSVFASLYGFELSNPQKRQLERGPDLLIEGYRVALPPAPAEDLTGDRFVDFADLTVLLASWNLPNVTAAQGNLVEPDVTSVDFADLTVLLSAWTGPAPAAAAAEVEAASQAVPEPSTFALAVLAMLTACATNRRRRNTTPSR